jgi:hypothetical protein
MAIVLPIPDPHGTHEWEKIINEVGLDNVDYVVFHGDYFDSWENKWPDQGENFKKICDLKRQYPNKIETLIGNHDWSYLTGTRDGEFVSGHQKNKVHEIRSLILANNDILDLACEIDGIVFSHAGFSNYWVKNVLFPCIHVELDEWPDDDTGKKGSVWDENEFSIDFLNKYWHSHTHQHGDPTFYYGFDEILDWHGLYDGAGDEEQQGPLWIRPASLIQNPYYKKQVVGHTEIKFNHYLHLKKNDNDLILIDSPEHNLYQVINTENIDEVKWENIK